MKKFMILFAAVALLASCSDDNDKKIDRKDYGMKTFSADLKYEGSAYSYNQQVYFAFGKNEPVALGEKGTKSWTDFDILPKVPEDPNANPQKLIDNTHYNVTTKVKGWDLVFTSYVGDAQPGETVYPYKLTGVLINREKVRVGFYEYKDSKEEAQIEKAFADLKMSNLPKDLKYSDDIDAIGYNWKKLGQGFTYTVNTNYFYIVKTNSGSYYKLHFLSFYGATKNDRIIKCEYALMK